MDPIDALDKIIPFIVFAIWIASAVLGQGKKKRRQPKPPVPISEGHKKKGPTIFEDLRRSLKTALEEIDPETTSTATPPFIKGSVSQPPAAPVYDDYQRDDVSLESSSMDDAEPEPGDTVSTTEDAVASKSHRIEKLRQISILQSNPRSSTSKKTGTISVKKLREGIIWSEVLGPPVSLRQ